MISKEKLENSPFGGKFVRGKIELEFDIFRMRGEKSWKLKYRHGNAEWIELDEYFDSDHEAYTHLISSVEFGDFTS